MTAARCPVCVGKGRVVRGFYDGLTNTVPTTTAEPQFETCRACGGRGVVWSPTPPPTVKTLVQYELPADTMRILTDHLFTVYE